MRTFAINMLSTFRRYGLVVSPGVLAYVRTLITADTIRVELAPRHDMLRHVERFPSCYAPRRRYVTRR